MKLLRDFFRDERFFVSAAGGEMDIVSQVSTRARVGLRDKTGLIL